MTEEQTTWRMVPQKDVINLIRQHHSKFGISRIADITGLDQVGIPVCIAIRPVSKTLALSSGKGITLDSSFISAGMEAIETHTAEFINPSLFNNVSWSSLPKNERLNPSVLKPYLRVDDFLNLNISWLECDITTDVSNKAYLPASLIGLSSDCLAEPVRIFRTGSNGLASGLSNKEAYLSALYELIERDAMQCWRYAMQFRGLKQGYIRTSSIPFESTSGLISRLNDIGIEVFIFDYTTDIEIPVYRCLISGDIDNAVPLCQGFGCHDSHEIALNRAITEAVQARTVLISGARDDYTYSTLKSSYRDYKEFIARQRRIICEDYQPINSDFIDVDQSIDKIHSSFERCDIGHIYKYDFQEVDPFHVTRVVIPGLVPLTSHSHEQSIYGRQIDHPRLIKFSPKIDGIRRLIFSLHPANSNQSQSNRL